MGAGLAEAAAKRGDEVVVFNRTIEKARALETFGARVAATAEEAVRGADRIHIVLSDDAAVDGVLAHCLAAVGSAAIVDHSTVSPAGTAERSKRLTALGIRFVHAPVFMSPAMCRESKGMMLAAGPLAAFQAVEPALRAMTGTLDYLGERSDLAAAYKLFGNAMILTVTAGLADVYSMAASLDIPATDAHALFSKFNPLGVLTYRGASMAKGDYHPSFELTMARKDARLMIETAELAARKLGVLPAIEHWMDTLIARGHGADDLGVLAIDAVPKKAD